MHLRFDGMIYFKYILLIASMLCATTGQANAFVAGRAKSLDLVEADAAGALSPKPVSIPAGAGGIGWLRLSPVATTLHLAPSLVLLRVPEILAAFEVPEPLRDPARRPVPDPTHAQASIPDRSIAASLSAAPAPAGNVFPLMVSQDIPLFGANRIRFGKIASGARIASLIHKAAYSGPSEICRDSCIDLAARLDLGQDDIVAQIRHVSAAVNHLITYRTDERNHGRRDHWSTPDETLARLSGDCEDYAILKMAVLARLGVPVSAMEIVVVKDTDRRLFHAVLSVSLQNQTLILDNMADAVEPDTTNRSYAPLFSFSGSATYIFGYRSGSQNLAASLKDMTNIAPGAGF